MFFFDMFCENCQLETQLICIFGLMTVFLYAMSGGDGYDDLLKVT